MPEVSVVVTVRDEEKHLRHLLDSLTNQRHLREVIVVDSDSRDRTPEILDSYRGRLKGLTIIRQGCKRGEGRNIGAARATGDILAFIDGDCIANPFWLESLVAAGGGEAKTIVAGQTRLVGFWAFTKLNRVELQHAGQDTSWPSCNLAYPRSFFEALGGFDPAFVTAEDIDLNYRAAAAGGRIVHAPDAIVYAQARDSITGFLRQAYWNGYGRKQLTLKHGRLWGQYKLRDMLRLQGASFWGLLRMGFGFLGYMRARGKESRAAFAPHGGSS